MLSPPDARPLDSESPQQHLEFQRVSQPARAENHNSLAQSGPPWAAHPIRRRTASAAPLQAARGHSRGLEEPQDRKWLAVKMKALGFL